jgi:hypothetical protein
MYDIGQIVQDLYDSEVNARIEWFHEGGFSVSIGDMLTGWKASGNFRTFTAAVEWLNKEAIQRYPDSAFAKKYRQ